MGLERERELVQKARKGDDSAYRALVEQNMRRVYALALRYTNRHEDADDIAQETFIRAHRSLGRFRAESSFGTWVYRIAVNCCLSHRRKQKRWDAMDSVEESTVQPTDRTSPSPLRKAMSSQTRQLINDALEELSPRQKMVFVMKYLQQRSIADIAEKIGCAEGTVKKQLFRAVGRMRQLLSPLLSQTNQER